MLLDLFDGKITLTELLDTDIPIINQLRDAKLRIKEKQNALSGNVNKVQKVESIDVLKNRLKKANSSSKGKPNK